MKLLLLATFVAICTGSTLFRGKRIVVNDDGSVQITSSTGNSVLITRPVDITGRRNTDVVIAGPKIPLQKIQIGDETSNPSLLRGFRCKDDILCAIFEENQGPVSEEMFENLLNQIETACKNNQISWKILDLLVELDQLQQAGSGKGQGVQRGMVQGLERLRQMEIARELNQLKQRTFAKEQGTQKGIVQKLVQLIERAFWKGQGVQREAAQIQGVPLISQGTQSRIVQELEQLRQDAQIEIAQELDQLKQLAFLKGQGVQKGIVQKLEQLIERAYWKGQGVQRETAQVQGVSSISQAVQRRIAQELEQLRQDAEREIAQELDQLKERAFWKRQGTQIGITQELELLRQGVQKDIAQELSQLKERAFWKGQGVQRETQIQGVPSISQRRIAQQLEQLRQATQNEIVKELDQLKERANDQKNIAQMQRVPSISQQGTEVVCEMIDQFGDSLCVIKNLQNQGTSRLANPFLEDQIDQDLLLRQQLLTSKILEKDLNDNTVLNIPLSTTSRQLTGGSVLLKDFLMDSQQVPEENQTMKFWNRILMGRQPLSFSNSMQRIQPIMLQNENLRIPQTVF